eukprot:3174458-Rhodomonas_salina.1
MRVTFQAVPGCAYYVTRGIHSWFRPPGDSDSVGAQEWAGPTPAAPTHTLHRLSACCSVLTLPDSRAGILLDLARGCTESTHGNTTRGGESSQPGRSLTCHGRSGSVRRAGARGPAHAPPPLRCLAPTDALSTCSSTWAQFAQAQTTHDLLHTTKSNATNPKCPQDVLVCMLKPRGFGDGEATVGAVGDEAIEHLQDQRAHLCAAPARHAPHEDASRHGHDTDTRTQIH